MQKSKYDEQALKQIHVWKNPQIGWFGYAMKWVNSSLDGAGDYVLDLPAVGEVIKRTVQGLTGICTDAAMWTISTDAIYKEFRNAGHTDVRTASDIGKLKLEQIDKTVGWLDAKYKGTALVQGAGCGAVGLLGIPPDIIALITLNLRAIGEYATYYGFEIKSQRERLFALNVLGLASSPTDLSKTLAMAQLVRIAQDVARKRAWKELERHAFVQVVKPIAKSVGIRLTKDKLAQLVPVTGAIIGGGFNAYFTSNVCQAAYYLYRERFLAAKYGVEVIDETVPAAADLDSHYPEEDEMISLLTSTPDRGTPIGGDESLYSIKDSASAIGERATLVRERIVRIAAKELKIECQEIEDNSELHSLIVKSVGGERNDKPSPKDLLRPSGLVFAGIILQIDEELNVPLWDSDKLDDVKTFGDLVKLVITMPERSTNENQVISSAGPKNRTLKKKSAAKKAAPKKKARKVK